MQIVHDGRGRDQLVAIEIFGQDPGRRGLEGVSTMGTIFSGKAVEDLFGLQRPSFQYQTFPMPLVDQRATTLWTVIAYYRLKGNNPFGF